MSYKTVVKFLLLNKKMPNSVLFISVAQCFHVALRVHPSVYVCIENNASIRIIMCFKKNNPVMGQQKEGLFRELGGYFMERV